MIGLGMPDKNPGYQMRMKLVPIGLEWDGRIVPVDQLSYRKADGEIVATERLTYSQALALAQQSCFKTVRIESVEDVPASEPTVIDTNPKPPSEDRT